MKHLDQIKLILFMIVKVMIYLWAKLLLMLEKVVQLYLLLFLEKCLMLIGAFHFCWFHFKRVDFHYVDLLLVNYIYNLLKNKFLIIKFVRNSTQRKWNSSKMDLGENGSRNKWKPANVENPIFMMYTHVDYVDAINF